MMMEYGDGRSFEAVGRAKLASQSREARPHDEE